MTPYLLAYLSIPLHSCSGDKVHNRGRILRCERIMSLALLFDDLDFAAKLLVSLFNLKRIVLEPRVEAAANVKKRRVGFGQGGEIIERLGFRQGIVTAVRKSKDQAPSSCCSPIAWRVVCRGQLLPNDCSLPPKRSRENIPNSPGSRNSCRSRRL